MTLGLLPVAVAKGDFRATNWLAARQQLDCPMTCKTVDMYVIMGGTDHKDRKPISICTTRKDRYGKGRDGVNKKGPSSNYFASPKHHNGKSY